MSIRKEDNILIGVLEKRVSRRSFVKWSTALGATASMSGLIMQAGTKAAGGHTYEPATSDNSKSWGKIVDWKPSCCLVCHGWCHIACGVDIHGHIRKIEGAGGQPKNYIGTTAGVKPYPATATLQAKADDANHIPTPAGYLAYAPHNKGRICAKGNDGVEHLYDPDRVKYPLARVGERGSGKWKRITWDDALTEIANVLRELAGRTTNVNGSNNAGRGLDLRHRFVHYVGRNETFGPKNFTKAYGSPNHIEHTSLCELGRHVAGRTMYGHHWSSVDLQVHTDTYATPWPKTSQGGPLGDASLTLDSNVHDNDCYIEWGGNPCEAKIPHSAWANHLGDRRRRNLQGLSNGAARGTGVTTYGRVMCIDVRQSNTAAWADEYFTLTPGTDGALALGLLYYAMDAVGTETLRKELDRGHMGGTGGKTIVDPGYDASTRLYYGLFTAEESGTATGGGTALGSASTTVPADKSLESYLFGLGAAAYTFAGHLGVANNRVDILAKVASLTNMTPGDIAYLGNIFAYGREGTSGVQKFLNVVTDTYRGPVKHTNGVYNTRAIRALQIIAPNHSARQFGALMYPAGVEPVIARGGYNAPGAFISDGNWNPYDFGGGAPADVGNPSASSSASSSLPADQGAMQGDLATSRQRIDDWDYDYDVPRWRTAYKWVDQNLSPGIRHSVGMDPFKLGDTSVEDPLSPNYGKGWLARNARKADGGSGPNGPYYYKNWLNQSSGTVDTDFKVEAVLIHKNAPGYARPQQDNELELLIARTKDSAGDYLLKHYWAIDIAMGDGTRFADMVLPEACYLERYSARSGEAQEFNYRMNTFYRLPVYEVNDTTIGGQPVPRHIYDVRQNAAIFYELARLIEPGKGAYGEAPWNGQLYDAFDYATGDVGNRAGCSAYVNDGEWAIKNYINTTADTNLASAASAASAGSGSAFLRSHAMIWNTNDRPAYWRLTSYLEKDAGHSGGNVWAIGSKLKPSGPVGGMLTVFNSVLDSVPDIKVRVSDTTSSDIATYATKADGTFFGVPVWMKPIQLESWSQTSQYPLHLTTYKVNVHTQSRTANLPRLQEILGNSWAVIHPDTAAAQSPPISNGDTIEVHSETGFIEAVAKVSPKAQPNCVHISHSQGHRVNAYSVAGSEWKLGAAFGTYEVNGIRNRFQDNTLRNGPFSPCDDWSRRLSPSAPGKGTHCNIVITHHLEGDSGTGRNVATDAVGGDQAWFDTKVWIKKA